MAMYYYARKLQKSARKIKVPFSVFVSHKTVRPRSPLCYSFSFIPKTKQWLSCIKVEIKEYNMLLLLKHICN